MLLSSFGYKFCGACHRVDTAVAFSACEIGGRISRGWLCAAHLFQSASESTLADFTDRSLSLGQLLVEVGDLLLRAFGVIAEAIAGLHRVDQNVGRRGTGGVMIEGIVSSAQARHRSGEAIEFCAARSESGGTAHFDSYFG